MKSSVRETKVFCSFGNPNRQNWGDNPMEAHGKGSSSPYQEEENEILPEGFCCNYQGLLIRNQVRIMDSNQDELSVMGQGPIV